MCLCSVGAPREVHLFSKEEELVQKFPPFTKSRDSQAQVLLYARSFLKRGGFSSKTLLFPTHIKVQILHLNCPCSVIPSKPDVSESGLVFCNGWLNFCHVCCRWCYLLRLTLRLFFSVVKYFSSDNRCDLRSSAIGEKCEGTLIAAKFIFSIFSN